MVDITLHDFPDKLHTELQRRAQANGHTIEEEVYDLLEELMTRERYRRIAEDEGLGAALQAIGRDFDITDEFDNLREKQTLGHAGSK